MKNWKLHGSSSTVSITVSVIRKFDIMCQRQSLHFRPKGLVAQQQEDPMVPALTENGKRTQLGTWLNKQGVIKETKARHFFYNESWRKGERVNVCEDWLLNIHEDPNFLTKVITGDGTWVYGYDPETKRHSSQWLPKNAPKPKKARMSKSKTKVLLVTFFGHQGIVHYEFLPQGQTINQRVYLVILRSLRKTIQKKGPEKWILGE
ncbi:hypothetical protein LAZ67_X003242 [Cordylochernes scorpioides]|uniref:Transposase n=1 Tax=Cordylochernes scorpioides TaxID=51811 RepID=A0ABY6LU03_9ARAC|nr:hypothetical protein LAZ67_X003242 [Cordylochernes scorpioides]